MLIFTRLHTPNNVFLFDEHCAHSGPSGFVDLNGKLKCDDVQCYDGTIPEAKFSTINESKNRICI